MATSEEGAAHDEHRYALLEGKLIDAEGLGLADRSRLRQAGPGLTCPVCREPLIPKLGEVVKWHFAHRADSEYRWHEPESKPHLKAKGQLAGHARSLWPQAAVREERRL